MSEKWINKYFRCSFYQFLFTNYYTNKLFPLLYYVFNLFSNFKCNRKTKYFSMQQHKQHQWIVNKHDVNSEWSDVLNHLITLQSYKSLFPDRSLHDNKDTYCIQTLTRHSLIHYTDCWWHNDAAPANGISLMCMNT